MNVKLSIKEDPIIKKMLSGVLPLMDSIVDLYIFGSRCRDDWRPNSDYDILLVVKEKNKKIISQLYDVVIDILLETGRLVSLKIFTEAEFNRLASLPTPFMKNVLSEGVRLGTKD